jgi:WD40 repeat protein
VRVWDLATSTLRATLTGHTDAVHALGCAQVHGRQAVVVAFDPDWRTDGEVQVWDLTTGAAVTMLAGHEAWVHAVVCTEVNGRPIAITASGDETVRIWNVASSTEIALLDYTGRALCVSSTQEVVIGTGWGLTVVHPPADVSECCPGQPNVAHNARSDRAANTSCRTNPT